MHTPKRYELSVVQVATATGRSTDYIRELARAGRIPSKKHPDSGRWKFATDDLGRITDILEGVVIE